MMPSMRPHERPRLLLPNLAALAALLVVVAPPVPVHAEGAVPPHLPTRVNAPGPWSSDETVDGPIAAIGIAMRRQPRGLTDDVERLAPFAVSATDGHSYWLRLPGFSTDDAGLVGGVALAPDGRHLGWVRLRPRAVAAEPVPLTDPFVDEPEDDDLPAPLEGWSVLDTDTGKIRRLTPTGEGALPTLSELAFSGDSRYLLTSHVPAGRPDDSVGIFTAWDVRTGRPSVLERPGRRWLPIIGSAPSGVVWARGSEVFRRETLAGPATTLRFPTDVWAASWAPEGSGFAYIAAPRKRGGDAVLHVGRDVAAARTTTVALHPDGPLGRIVGWRDADHVVVDHYRRDLDVVDVRDGSVRNIDLAGAGKQLNTPAFAADLWSARLQDPAERKGLHDPRSIWRWGAAAGAVVLGVAVLRRIRVRR